MIFSRCKFCGHEEASSFLVVTKKRSSEYFRCKYCGAISLSDKCFLSPAQQHERYKQHNNALEDLGYTRFLGEFLLKTFSFLPSFPSATGYRLGNTRIQNRHAGGFRLRIFL